MEIVKWSIILKMKLHIGIIWKKFLEVLIFGNKNNWNNSFNEFKSTEIVFVYSTVKKIDYRTFRRYSNFTHIRIPENLSRVNSFVFSWCWNNTHIQLISSSISPGYSVCCYCSSLTTIYWSCLTQPSFISEETYLSYNV